MVEPVLPSLCIARIAEFQHYSDKQTMMIVCKEWRSAGKEWRNVILEKEIKAVKVLQRAVRKYILYGGVVYCKSNVFNTDQRRNFFKRTTVGKVVKDLYENFSPSKQPPLGSDWRFFVYDTIPPYYLKYSMHEYGGGKRVYARLQNCVALLCRQRC